MGFKDVDWAYGLDLPSGQKVVLAALCHRTDDKTHQTFVGRKLLAEMVGMTDRGISKILAALDETGAISRQERRRADGYRDTDLITVNIAYTGSQVNAVQVNQEQVNEVPVNEVRISGELSSDLRGTTFEARESKDSLVTQRSPIDHSFEQAWVNWPKRVEKKKSLAAFIKAAKTRDAETLVADIIRHGNAFAATREKQFVPALCVWLAGERWTDELPTAGVPGGRPAGGNLRRLHGVTSLDPVSLGDLPPGHIPTDDEWNAMLADPKPLGTRVPPSVRELAAADCGDHPGYPLINGICDKCDAIQLGHRGAA